MPVNSINFWLFFIIVLAAYFGIFRKSCRWQNITLLVSSYVFYGLVNWKMCLLLLIYTTVFYFLGIKIGEYNEKDEGKASHLTAFAVTLGIGLLLYFKYLGFFIEEFSKLLVSIGLQTNPSSFKIIMPVGISFFTFKLMGYAIDVHWGTMKPCKDPIAFGSFIAFFPTIMSGPIDRPAKFLHQLESVRKINSDEVAEGLKCILWGMFLKMCIANQLAGYTHSVFDHYEHHNSTSIIIASLLYTFQVYADFCGYSDMSIGVSRILGLKISENFKRPLLGQNIAEFWRRWHISLTTWMTDYVFTPLNFAFRGLGRTGVLLAVFINLVIIGAWHGPNLTYILFGVYHAILFVLFSLFEERRKSFEIKHTLRYKWWYKCSGILLTFIFVDFSMVLFQSKSISDFFGIVKALGSGFGTPFLKEDVLTYPVICIAILLVKELCEENGKNVRVLHSPNVAIRYAGYIFLIVSIMLFGGLNGKSFIYFQF